MQTIIDVLIFLFLAAIPAASNYFIDYCLGHPMSEKISTKAIFFRYSLWLAKKALPDIRLREIQRSFEPLLNNDDPDIRRQGQDQLKQTIMLAGKEYFTYQQAIGMCPFCTNFWFSQVAAIIFYFTIPLAVINPIFFFIVTPIFSHSILRKL